jgi:proline dehydrogenase
MFNKLIVRILPYLPEKFIWIFSRRYVAGQTIDEAIEVCKELNAQGMKTTIDVLGEFIKTLDEAEANKNEYLRVIDTAQKNNIDGNYSLKPTMFGLLLDKEACYRYIREIVAKASGFKNFIRIDMENSSCTSLEIELYSRLKKDFPNNVGLVFQAYLKRTFRDMSDLLELNSSENPLNFRLCKGIYEEPPSLAFKKQEDIHSHFIQDLEFLFKNNIYAGIATHNEILIDAAFDLIKKYNVPSDRYEFQMLLGVTPGLRKSIVEKGHTIRIYVPFGEKWFSYSIRRLKENPKMAGMIVKAFIKKPDFK